MKEYDIIIVGAGCSGLSLAYRLINTKYKVCVIDNNSKTNRIRKTWSYWDTYKHPFKELAKSFNNNLCISNNSNVTLDCSRHNYSSIDSYDFDKFIFKKIDDSSNIEITFETEIIDISEYEGSYKINMPNKSIQSQYVFDSRPASKPSKMKQVFKGLFIKTDEQLKTFKSTLMDFSDSNEFHFFYCLDMGNNTYLFESTYYTSLKKEQSEMTKEINKYIKENYQINYSVIREEYGEIPLTTNIRINNKNSKLTNIGIPAGSTRASTGYTFLNIQKQADEYIKKLAGEDYKEYSRTFKNVILRKMDNILLMIIKDRPVYSKSILFRLFERNEDNRIIRFLSDAPSIIDILIIIWNMPKIIFIKYAIKSLTARNL